MTIPKILLSALFASTLFAQNNLTTTATQRYFGPIRRSLEGSADVMPAEKYSFKLTDGQMSFAEWLIHSTQRNYTDCSTLKGEPVPEIYKSLESMKDKAAVSKALKDSFAYCAAAIEGIDDLKVLGTPQMTNALLHIVVHNNEIYGNIVGYMRASGIVPPSTAARTAPKKQ